MKTQNYNNLMKQVLFGALVVFAMMTTACNKGSKGHSAPPPPVAMVPPGGCMTYPCNVGAGGGQYLYGGTTINGYYTQAQFQVYGDMTGNGIGSIAGVVTFNNFICQVGTALSGPYQIQMMQQGSLTADVFSGYVGLIGPQGTIQAAIQVVPSRTQGTNLFSLYVCNQQIDMNF